MLIFLKTGLLIIVIKLLFSAISVFLAIIAWKKIRTFASLFFLLGILFLYLLYLYLFVSMLGFIPTYPPFTGDISIVNIFFHIMPLVFFILALVNIIKDGKM
ncbi:hypothetical protein [Treponema phagedenis]|uniref:Uncharacterized protein n=1 Tax=Treponema phagedenis TaxID=162 RepID=A0AAE6IU63_TREPH|nr:hypothetical protein [Treponema phagedenis]NVP22979.1 hypothetical protein [Treponema phagedenis]QEJ95100.1 hypothetical protein FUT79_07740 [Treponema phagedenis]QEJ98228.1 hypothetical protein FUT82_09605 [Treponema phagedenis]QEK03738.1 hypothetical protein FUT83_07920 [Treponema phagedenis]QEK09353.1 hypothetical protein FUT81_07830 [Treponema phagedenis]